MIIFLKVILVINNMKNQIKKCRICEEPYNSWSDEDQGVCPDCKSKADAKDKK